MKKILPLMLIAFAVIACSSCAQQPRPAPPPDPSPVEVVDAGPAPVFDAAPPPAPIVGDICGAAEAKAAALNCPLAPTAKGDPWATVCRAYQANGVDMHAKCVAGAADCNGVTACLVH